MYKHTQTGLWLGHVYTCTQICPHTNSYTHVHECTQTPPHAHTPMTHILPIIHAHLSFHKQALVHTPYILFYTKKHKTMAIHTQNTRHRNRQICTPAFPHTNRDPLRCKHSFELASHTPGHGRVGWLLFTGVFLALPEGGVHSPVC